MLSFLFVLGLNAQSMKIEDVLKLNLRQSGTITNAGKVEGHYIFYSSGKAKKGEKNFILRILDTELNKVIDKKITLDKNIILINGVSNGRSLAFRFFDPRERLLITKGYDFKGNQLFNKKLELKKGMEQETILANDMFFKELGLVSVPEFGYLQINPLKDKKLTYSMNFISDDKSVKSFSKLGNVDRWQNATNICTSGDVVVNLIMSREKLFKTKDIDMHIQGVNIKTGKKLFTTSLKSLKYNTMIVNGEPSPDGENIILYGLNFPKGEKITSKPKGMIKFVMNKKGEVLESYPFDWKGKSIKLDKDEEAGNLFVHDFILGKNGNTFLIAEQLNVNVGASIAGSILSTAVGGTQGVNFAIDDIIVIELDKEFKFINAEIIEKQKNGYMMEGIPMGGIHSLGLIARGRGYFDYAYNQVTDEGFMIAFVNYEREKGKKNGLVFGGATYTDGTYTIDKIDISNKGVSTRILQAKPGYVILMDYIRKEKTLEMRLEKINF